MATRALLKVDTVVKFKIWSDDYFTLGVIIDIKNYRDYEGFTEQAYEVRTSRGTYTLGLDVPITASPEEAMLWQLEN